MNHSRALLNLIEELASTIEFHPLSKSGMEEVNKIVSETLNTDERKILFTDSETVDDLPDLIKELKSEMDLTTIKTSISGLEILTGKYANVLDLVIAYESGFQAIYVKVGSQKSLGAKLSNLRKRLK